MIDNTRKLLYIKLGLVLLMGLVIIGLLGSVVYYRKLALENKGLTTAVVALDAYISAFRSRSKCIEERNSLNIDPVAQPNYCDEQKYMERQWRQAARLLEEVIQEPSLESASRINLKQKLAYSYLSGRQYDKSIALYEELLRMPQTQGMDSCFYQYMIGESYAYKGDFEAAIQTYEKNLAKCGMHLSSLNGIGQVYIRQGRQTGVDTLVQKGCAYIQQAMGMGSKIAPDLLRRYKCSE